MAGSQSDFSRGGKAGGKPKGRALADFTVHPKLAVHKVGQALADGKAKACATIVARGAVIGLTKSVKQALLCILTDANARSEEHTSELQSRPHLVCRLLLEKKKQ